MGTGFLPEEFCKAMITISPQNSGGQVQETTVENMKAAVQMVKGDHPPEGGTMMRLLALAAAQPNMDPALPAKWNRRGNLKGSD